MRSTIFLTAVLGFVSCASNSQTKLMDDPDVNKVFNKQEISALSMIVNSFDEIIIKNSGNQEIAAAYAEYFELIDSTEYFENMHVSLTNSERMIKKLMDQDLFGQIWKYAYSYDFITKDTLTINLSVNLQGKYFELLNLIGESNSVIKEYSNSIQKSGSIGPRAIAGVMKKYYREVDFHREVNRLIWAIHYITIVSEEEYKKDSEMNAHKFSGTGGQRNELSLIGKETTLKLSYEFYKEPDELIVYDQSGKELHRTGMRATTNEVTETINIYDVTQLLFKIESKETNSKWKFSVTVK